MEEDEIVLEDGELSDDSDTYTPLERPANYSASQPDSRFPSSVAVPESESEAELQSTDSDSDSDCNRKKSKKPKIKLKPKFEQASKQKKYDIWSTRVQEDVLAETLNSCDVTIKDRSRSVESYGYLGNHFVRRNNKRTREDRSNPHVKSVGRMKSEEKVRGNSRNILDLAVNSSDSPENIAKDIANKLYEEKEDLILRVVNTLGREKAFELFKETKRIEEEGGMLIMNQTRRRTPGGVFLFLVRHDDITQEQKSKIFEDEKQKARIMLRNKQKKKLKKLKDEIVASKNKLLPDLLRTEMLAKETNRVRKETDERDVINPPPTPETDGHENSGDGMEGTDSLDSERRKFEAPLTYDDDFLDINCSNDMDLF